MADMPGEFHEYRLKKNGHEFEQESTADTASRLVGFVMFAGGGGATVLGHPGGAGVALSGAKIALGDEPAKKLKSHITGAGGSAAAGEAGKKIAESDPFGLNG